LRARARGQGDDIRPSSLHPIARSSLAKVDDDRLVALVRAGDEDAFTEVYARHRVGLRRVAIAVLRGSAHDADDVLQDAFLSAYAALRAIDRPIVLKAWLVMIVRNKAIDALRQPYATRVDPDSERALALVPAPMGDPSDVTCLKEEVREVVDAIAALPDRQRLALVRREFEGRRVQEVAAGLGATESSITSLLSRARRTVAADRRRAAV